MDGTDTSNIFSVVFFTVQQPCRSSEFSSTACYIGGRCHDIRIIVVNVDINCHRSNQDKSSCSWSNDETCKDTEDNHIWGMVFTARRVIEVLLGKEVFGDCDPYCTHQSEVVLISLILGVGFYSWRCDDLVAMHRPRINPWHRISDRISDRDREVCIRVASNRADARKPYFESLFWKLSVRRWNLLTGCLSIRFSVCHTIVRWVEETGWSESKDVFHSEYVPRFAEFHDSADEYRPHSIKNPNDSVHLYWEKCSWTTISQTPGWISSGHSTTGLRKDTKDGTMEIVDVFDDQTKGRIHFGWETKENGLWVRVMSTNDANREFKLRWANSLGG